MTRTVLLLSALLLGASATTYADTTFSLVNNTFESGATATGTLNIDTTAGLFDSINVTYSLAGTNYVFTGAPIAQGTSSDHTQYFEYSSDQGGNLLLVDVPGSSLVGYNGGNLCSFANLCGAGDLGYFALKTGPTTGVADPLATGSLAATPEPSSLILLGSGLLGLTGIARAAPDAQSSVVRLFASLLPNQEGAHVATCAPFHFIYSCGYAPLRNTLGLSKNYAALPAFAS